mgnify:CR=1 FL=1
MPKKVLKPYKCIKCGNISWILNPHPPVIYYFCLKCGDITKHIYVGRGKP